MQRHERGDPIQELRLIRGVRTTMGVALQHRKDEACNQVVGLELAQEVPALPDANGLQQSVPELRGTQRYEPGRNPDPCPLIEPRLHEFIETRDVHHPGADDEAALPRRVVEYIEVDVGGYSVGRTLQGVQLARLYKAEVSRAKPVPASFYACHHLSLLYVHQQVIQEAPRSRIPRGPYGKTRVANVWDYRFPHRRHPFSGSEFKPFGKRFLQQS